VADVTSRSIGALVTGFSEGGPGGGGGGGAQQWERCGRLNESVCAATQAAASTVTSVAAWSVLAQPRAEVLRIPVLSDGSL
jgi:hypothetical protein